jgi:hypothetical protein
MVMLILRCLIHCHRLTYRTDGERQGVAGLGAPEKGNSTHRGTQKDRNRCGHCQKISFSAMEGVKGRR